MDRPVGPRLLRRNWQSEYLQLTLFVLATVWLVQKPVGAPHAETATDG